MRVPRIKVMSESLRNQIAAGEVVERPASVVKELVENSLDAGALRVVVEVEQGGRERIRVVDDGSGMNREEALLALQRHATSKCASIEELHAIGTFGFRGEALPSIASVSRFVLTTRTAEDAVGTRVSGDGGGELTVVDAAAAVGTEISINDLFFNVPARRKFLKADATEHRNIVEVIQRMALSHHRVHFTYLADGRKVLDLPPERDRMARIHAVLGRKVCDHLYECALDGRITVSGFVTRPDLSRRGTAGLFTFVNGRFVRDKLIIQAILNGYSTLLPRGEYPYAVVDIHVPAGELDVNVHPAKSEVRFERSSEVFAAIARAVKLTLSDAPWVSEGLASRGGPAGPALPALPRGGDGRWAMGDGRWDGSRPEGKGEDRVGPAGPNIPPAGGPPKSSAASSPGPPNRLAPELPLGRTGRGFGNLRYLGQYANCFLLGQVDDRFVVVDQHAAHERVIFERLREQIEAGVVASQPLLVPRMVEVEPALVATVAVREEALARLGFEVEPFGGNTLAVKRVPVLLKQRSPEPVIRAVLEQLDESTGETGPAELFHRPLATMACHLAVRGGDPMEKDEAVALFAQMDRIDLAAFCPHGRPVVVFFSQAEVGRWFQRS